MVSNRTKSHARLEQLRAEQARRRRRHRGLVVAVAGVSAASVTAAVVWAATGSSAIDPTVSATGVAITGLHTYTGLSRSHTEGTVRYQQTPPVGGAHSPVWQNCGWYDNPVAAENAVHSLEHSAVWVTYDPSLSASDKSTLKSELDGRAYVLASPYRGLPGRVVASAWGEQVVLTGVSDPRLLQFVSEFAGSAAAPEPGGECTGGVGSPS